MTTFSRIHLVPEGRGLLACSYLVPDEWVRLPLPDEAYDFDTPSVFQPLIICMAPCGAVVFTIAARPAFEDGSVQDWAECLAGANGLAVERVREARINRMPSVLVDATMSSEAGPMRSRSVFLDDGGRLFNIGALAPEAIWPSVVNDLQRLLGSFTLEEVKGITTAPLREMTSESAVDLSADFVGESSAPMVVPTVDEAVDSSAPLTPESEETSPLFGADAEAHDDRPTQASDVALADDAASLSPGHEVNVRRRELGAGEVPRVIMVATRENFASIAAVALDGIFRVPFGWHVVDDGRRTLVFDPDSRV